MRHGSGSGVSGQREAAAGRRTENMERFRIGIIGAGHIAEKMSRTIALMENVEAYAVASRDAAKAAAFAESFGFTKSYGSYEELADDPAVQLIYVATPHSFHHAHVRMCLEKGKPVLCEKAFMLNRAQAEDVIDLSHERKVFLAEAIWTRYLPSRREIASIIESGAIGKPYLLTANLGYPVAHKERIIRPELGGGALLDLGVYCINFALMHFGSDISETFSTSVKSPEGMDFTDNIVFHYSDGRVASLLTSVSGIDDRQGIIRGDKGYLVADNTGHPLRIDIYDRMHELVESRKIEEKITGFEYQVQECIDTILAGGIEPASMPHSETLKVMGIMDSLRKEWGVRFPGED